jgi:hypothetical protein
MPDRMRKGAGRLPPKPPAKPPTKDQVPSKDPNSDNRRKADPSKGKK